MSSLWTPEGEHRVPRPGATESGAGESPGPEPGAPGAPAGSGAPGRGPSQSRPENAGTSDEGEEDLATEEELLEVAKHLAAAPAEDVVANHCYGLFELAALHLAQQPPEFEKARLAIDALGLLVDGLGDRLGKHAAALTEGLAQIRLAFVRISTATPASDGQADPQAKTEQPE